MPSQVRKRSRQRHRPAEHRHSKAECLKLLRYLSDYLDNDLNRKICEQIRKHASICSKCDRFMTTLRQTIDLCRRVTPEPLSPALKARLRREILKAAAAMR